MIHRSAVTALDPGRFRIDFARLRGELGGVSGRFRWFADRRRVTLDPSLIGHALRAVMARCPTRSALDERLILWNEFWIILAPDDHEQLQPLLARLTTELDTVIRHTVTELAADLLAEPVVRIVADDEDRTPQGTGEVRARYNDRVRAVPSRAGELTVRVGEIEATRGAQPTQRIAEPAVHGDLHLAWQAGAGDAAQEALLAGGARVQLGRPHAGAPRRFIPLLGASRRINKCQLVIENCGDKVIITRLAHANPVQVTGRLIQPGGRLEVERLPARVSLSNGALELDLRRVGEARKTAS